MEYETKTSHPDLALALNHFRKEYRTFVKFKAYRYSSDEPLLSEYPAPKNEETLQHPLHPSPQNRMVYYSYSLPKQARKHRTRTVQRLDLWEEWAVWVPLVRCTS